jgi:hypothetical protein
MVQMTATADTGKKMNRNNNIAPATFWVFRAFGAFSPVSTRGGGFFLGENTWTKA